MSDAIAAEFFDQFEPAADAEPLPADGTWCERHFAPSSVRGALPAAVTQAMLTAFVAGHCPPSMKSRAMFRRQLAKAGHVCCVLGDQAMYEIWGRWPPAPADGMACQVEP